MAPTDVARNDHHSRSSDHSHDCCGDLSWLHNKPRRRSLRRTSHIGPASTSDSHRDAAYPSYISMQSMQPSWGFSRTTPLPEAPAAPPQAPPTFVALPGTSPPGSFLQLQLLTAPPLFGLQQQASSSRAQSSRAQSQPVAVTSRPPSPPRSPSQKHRDLPQVWSTVQPSSVWGMPVGSIAPDTTSMALGSRHAYLEMEGSRINRTVWAQKKIVRQKAQEQKDLIDRHAEVAMSNLERRREEQVAGLHSSVYPRFDVGVPLARSVSAPQIRAPSFPQLQMPMLGLHTAPSFPQYAASLGYGPRLPPPTMVPQVVEFPADSNEQMQGSPTDTSVLGSAGSSVQVLAEEKNCVDEFGQVSKRRIFSISGMDGEPLAIVQMLK